MDTTAQYGQNGRKVKTVTREEWRKCPRYNRSGDPRRGTATMVYWEPGVGTVMGPVRVVNAPAPSAPAG